jgi:CHAD domain-containing protein
MAHRIEKDEAIGTALARLAHEDLVAARRELSGGSGGRQERIHRVRQRLKRVRTLIRVLAPELGDQAEATRRPLSEVARMLAGARDADVAAASARGLAAATPHAGALGLDRVVKALDQEAADAHRERTPLAEVGRRLEVLAMEVAAFDSGHLHGGALITTALKRSYAAGREAMARARGSLATPDLHRWRKRVKDLWHLLRLTRERTGGKGARNAPRLERLGELLGLDHDHALLAEKLALSPEGDPALMAQLGLIADRRRTLEAEAFELGERIYRRRPKAFVKSLKLE